MSGEECSATGNDTLSTICLFAMSLQEQGRLRPGFHTIDDSDHQIQDLI